MHFLKQSTTEKVQSVLLRRHFELLQLCAHGNPAFLTATTSEVVRKIKAQVIILLMLWPCFTLTQGMAAKNGVAKPELGPISVSVTWSRSFRKAILLVTSSWARSSFSCSSRMLASWSLRFSLCRKKGTTRKGS